MNIRLVDFLFGRSFTLYTLLGVIYPYGEELNNKTMLFAISFGSISLCLLASTTHT